MQLGAQIAAHIRRPVGTILSVRLPRETLFALDERARREDLTLSALVRRALEQYLGGTYSISTAMTMTIGGSK